jgi:hypothetical protein
LAGGAGWNLAPRKQRHVHSLHHFEVTMRYLTLTTSLVHELPE